MHKVLVTKLLTGLLLFCNTIAIGQITQTVRGKCVDATTKFPLVGATISLIEGEKVLDGTVSDAQGYFRLEGVPVGRRSFQITYIGYATKVLNNIVINSAKETVLTVEMEEESGTLNSVTIKATKRNGEVSNEMATVSARTFSVDETERYAGSRGDPARMASNFAGVLGADDQRNDIVVRGNSPAGVIWQVDGVILPNPNHFAIPGTNGGPVSIINNKTLANSDFYTGAFPAEFGNSIAGVFDLKLRNGNNEQYEFSTQLGLLGLEAFAEGPISRDKRSSFLFNYRYSTISIFQQLGIDVGTNSAPSYQDATFRLSFPQKNGADLAIWGIGGLSNTSILISAQTEPVLELYGQSDRDQDFASNVGILGLTYAYPINANTFWKTTLAASTQSVIAHHQRIYDRDTFYVPHPDLPGDSTMRFDPASVLLETIMRYRFTENKYTASSFVYKKLKPGSVLKFGMMTDLYDMRFHDSLRIEDDPDYPNSQVYRTRWNADKQSVLVQPYAQWKYDFSRRLAINLGWHLAYYSIGNSLSWFEPRMGVKFKTSSRSSLNFGMGVHSQIQPNYLYFYAPEDETTGETTFYNDHLGFTKSAHAVLGWNAMIGKNLRFKTETYYQYLYNIPIDRTPSSFSMVNTGAGFSRFFPEPLVNAGVATNFGLEFTLEKFFSNNYFFMVTTSFYESIFQGSDGNWYDTDFNGNWIVNALGTKEFNVTENTIFGLGGKITAAGGHRYGDVDVEATDLQQEVIWVDSTRNIYQAPPYFRADLRITYKINRPKVTHEIAFDLVNITDQRNFLTYSYAPGISDNRNYVENYQLGFLPVFYYKIDF